MAAGDPAPPPQETATILMESAPALLVGDESLTVLPPPPPPLRRGRLRHPLQAHGPPPGRSAAAVVLNRKPVSVCELLRIENSGPGGRTGHKTAAESAGQPGAAVRPHVAE